MGNTLDSIKRFYLLNDKVLPGGVQSSLGILGHGVWH